MQRNGIMKKQKTKPKPSDIALPEGVILENGTLFVKLRDEDELAEFWRENKEKYPFAAEGRNEIFLGLSDHDQKYW